MSNRLGVDESYVHGRLFLDLRIEHRRSVYSSKFSGIGNGKYQDFVVRDRVHLELVSSLP